MIIVKDIKESQLLWAEWIINIGSTFSGSGDYIGAAHKMIKDLYGYNEGVVLFKPTKAGIRQFRLDTEGALSYFIGGNSEYPEDHGFALKPWINVRFENAGFILNDNKALAMGNYFFTDIKGVEMKVEYTIGYFRSEDGSLKINLHHSSLPYSSE